MKQAKYLIDQNVIEAVDRGLSAKKKFLPSWLFYDTQGNRIFQSIMRMPQYYPTRCETEILREYKELLLNYFGHKSNCFEILELGAGDGTKTEILLEYFQKSGADFKYRPLDVSEDVLNQLANRVKRRLPKVKIDPIAMRYDEYFGSDDFGKSKKIILFLGSNIGNFSLVEAREFVNMISAGMNQGDWLMIGFDLKKDPRTIQLAYDDPNGITRDFNMNLLRRMNRDLGADFHTDRFTHFPTYDPVSGSAKSYLVSLSDQTVYIDALEKSFHFHLWETIHTEVSQKYDVEMINEITAESNLQLADILYDSKKYFCDVLLVKE